MDRIKSNQPLSLAEKMGFATIIIAALIYYYVPVVSLLLLISYLLVCFVAPFLPRFSFYLPIIYRGKDGVNGVAITFDDGPSPLSTPSLLQLLERYQLKATFFVIGQNAAAYPELVRDILAKGHSVANHSYRHDNLLMFKKTDELKKDIQTTQSILKGLGVKSYIFRPPAGVTNPKLKPVLAATGLTNVNFSCRIFDGGNRRIGGLAKKVMRRIKPGDILMLHDTCPRTEELKHYWLGELEQLFKNLQKEYTVLPLEDVIKQPVMSVID